jgi:glycosyltransferase involved in cell wall biosynthesis
VSTFRRKQKSEVDRSDRPEFLLDISRLIWRAWRGALPTGIDRVCLEYLAHFGPRSLGVVQYKGRTFVLSREDSDALFSILLRPGTRNRTALAAAAPLAWARSSSRPPRANMLYLNVGHTGLHDPALPAWIAENGVRAVYLIHDLIPITHPQFCRPGEPEKHALRMENALRSAAGVIANSHATLDELRAFASSRSLALPKACAILISGQRALGKVRPRHLERPHFVTVGTIEGRKNHLLLLRIWRRLVTESEKTAPILVVIGQRGWQADEAFALLDRATDLKGHVVEHGDCSDVELAALVAGARALLMPSFAEGFGLPVIEALQLGTPVIAADLPVYGEIAGDIPTYLSPADEQGWEAAIRQFVHDCPDRERQKRAIETYTAPDWSSHFEKVESWLASLPQQP